MFSQAGIIISLSTNMGIIFGFFGIFIAMLMVVYVIILLLLQNTKAISSLRND
jgi:hypothetical protein